MQLNVTTDYAIRIVLYLGMKGGVSASTELSTMMKVPQKYILKITKRLVEAGLLEKHLGKNGGFSLTRPLAQITLFDIIQTMETTIKINRCLEEDHFCSRQATESCPVREFYCALQDKIENDLSSMTLETILHRQQTTTKDKKGT